MGLLKGLSRFLTRCPQAQSTTGLILIGPEDRETQALTTELILQAVVRSTKRVSYEDSLKYISSASTCILVEGKMAEGIFLPSKLADYIVARKPVLALSPDNGVVADMLPCKGIVRVDVDNEEGIEAAIANYYSAFENGNLSVLSPSDDLVRQFEGKAVAELFIRHVHELLNVNLSRK